LHLHVYIYRYLEIIIKQRALSELATQQLLLDTYSLKALVLSIPRINSSTADSPKLHTSYGKVVTSRVNQLEAVLKLLGTNQPSVMIERFLTLLPNASVVDLQVLMTSKGMKKADQQSAIDSFQNSASNSLKSASTSQTSSSDNFPLVVPLSTFLKDADKGSGISMATMAATASQMRNLTNDLSNSFSVGTLKWNK
jgi:hypothetical protein